MSTYDQLESSVESSRPIELFTFVLGAVSYYYTSSEDDVTSARSFMKRSVFLATNWCRVRMTVAVS